LVNPLRQPFRPADPLADSMQQDPAETNSLVENAVASILLRKLPQPSSRKCRINLFKCQYSWPASVVTGSVPVDITTSGDQWAFASTLFQGDIGHVDRDGRCPTVTKN
jgi:hypothetical protein